MSVSWLSSRHARCSHRSVPVVPRLSRGLAHAGEPADQDAARPWLVATGADVGRCHHGSIIAREPAGRTGGRGVARASVLRSHAGRGRPAVALLIMLAHDRITLL
jgi:hypothetical protein